MSHFVGYWGYGNRQELEVLLEKIFPQFHHKRFPEQNDRHPIWNVVHLSSSNKIDEKIASLSASGLSHSADVWVSLEGNYRLILGREPFGRVPLYWLKLNEVIWFSSQLKLLLSILENPEINLSGLYGYSCFSYVPTPLTPVTEINAISAGSELSWKADKQHQMIDLPQSHSLHQWKENPEQINDERLAISQLQTLLKNAIEQQISDLKDEPVGVFISGGIDSSIVAALLVQAGVNVRAYTLDFGSLGIPEYPFAEKVAEFLGIPLVKVKATPNAVKKAIIPTVKALDLPFGDGVTVPLYLLNQAASQDTQIIFNGEGGDQLFAGWTNKPLIAASVYGQDDFIENYLRTFHRLWGYEAQVYQPKIYEKIKNLQPELWIKDALEPTFCPSFLHRLRRATLMLKGAQNIHPRATNLALYHGLNVRSPFCDLALTEWTFKLSGELCLQGSCEKYILKRAVENWLPSEIVWRQKRGMGVPLTSWCLNNFWFQIGNWLNPGLLEEQHCFNPQIAVQIVSGELGANIQGRRIGETLWLLMMWQLWRVHILGEKAEKKSFNHPFFFPRQLWIYYQRFKNQTDLMLS
jgi:asparagine synthase (glutamine-hydrolysing)